MRAGAKPHDGSVTPKNHKSNEYYNFTWQMRKAAVLGRLGLHMLSTSQYGGLHHN